LVKSTAQKLIFSEAEALELMDASCISSFVADLFSCRLLDGWTVCFFFGFSDWGAILNGAKSFVLDGGIEALRVHFVVRKRYI